MIDNSLYRQSWPIRFDVQFIVIISHRLSARWGQPFTGSNFSTPVDLLPDETSLVHLVHPGLLSIINFLLYHTRFSEANTPVAFPILLLISFLSSCCHVFLDEIDVVGKSQVVRDDPADIDCGGVLPHLVHDSIEVCDAEKW